MAYFISAHCKLQDRTSSFDCHLGTNLPACYYCLQSTNFKSQLWARYAYTQTLLIHNLLYDLIQELIKPFLLAS